MAFEKNMKWIGLCLVLVWTACGGDDAPATRESSGATPGLSPSKVADMLHAVMAADRVVYTKQVVSRLVKQQQLQVVNPETRAIEAFAASEQWKSEHGKLPLPAQMFRMGADLVADQEQDFSYGLLSEWPINTQNRPRTPLEKRGLQAIARDGGKKPFYGDEVLGGRRYFTAIYADPAVSPACVDCHNAHPDSPRTDFKLGDVMGGVVIRILVSG